MTIGITGGIGSGKSTIARELAKRGFTVYDCDREAKRIIAENPEVRKAIINLLGEESFLTSHIYNTAYVAQRVFENKALLEAINQIVHPAVKEDIVAKHPDFVESAILYEAGLDKLCDKIVVIDAPEEIRIARTIARDYNGQCTEDNINKVRARMRAQEIVESRKTKVDSNTLLLCNDGKESIEALVEKITHWM